MTNVMRAYQKQQHQLLHDAPHRVARRLAQDIQSFLNRDDCVRSDNAEAIERHLRALRRGEYRECRVPPPKVAPEDEEQEAGEDGEEAEEEGGNDEEEEGDEEDQAEADGEEEDSE
jgi:hypothetical protein